MSRRERLKILRLLGLLQDHLETVIHSNTLADGSLPADEQDAAEVTRARRSWKAAETMVKRLGEMVV